MMGHWYASGLRAALRGSASALRQGDYVVFSALVKYDIDEKTTAQLNLTKLLDRKYYQTIGSTTGGNWYGPGFSAVGTLRVTF